jgi:SAM-dependent methyltransferase
MQTTANPNPDYGNWVSKKFIYVPGVLTLLLTGLSFRLPVFYVPALLFLLITAYFAYARFRFSPQGGDVQAQIVDLLLDRLDWDGQGAALDIGCGNGPLAIKLVYRFPHARVTGIDYWGKNWDYSQSVCEDNARAAGVSDRLEFRKASASKLPFPDASFDLAVSNLVFHEVSQVKDKRQLVGEALRVVKIGGRFAFQDLFLLEPYYGKPEELVALVKSWGISQVEFVKTCDAPFIPGLLKLPFMVGKIGILYGKK